MPSICAPAHISKAARASAKRRLLRPAVMLSVVLAASVFLLSNPRAGAGAGNWALAGGRMSSSSSSCRPAAAAAAAGSRAVGLRAVQPCSGGTQIDEAIAASAASSDGADARVLVLSFSLTRCGPCKLMDPKVEELARDFDGRAQFIKIVGDRDPDGMDLLTAFGVRAVPAYHIFNRGQQVSTIKGAKPKKLRRLLEEFA